MRNRRRTVWVGAAAAALLTMTACGGSDGDNANDKGVAPAGDSSSLAPGYGEGGSAGSDKAGGDAAKTGPAGTLSLSNDAKLGQIVTDSKGWTLYRFEEDTAKPPTSTCDGDCASAWPPVPASDATAASGMDASLVGQVTRDDGDSQLTLDGWPVYRYAKDAEPGDTTGHGVGGNWNALAADGKPAGGADAGTGAGDEGAGDGYGTGGGDADGSEPAGSAPGGDSDTAPDASLSAVQDPGLGTIVQDAQGRTLYRFDKDSAWPMKSNCEGECLEKWKPAKPVDVKKLKGVDTKMVSTLKRSDGSEQLAIDCWPVYWFTGDAKAGDTDGHGAQGTWWAVTPEGKKAKASGS